MKKIISTLLIFTLLVSTLSINSAGSVQASGLSSYVKRAISLGIVPENLQKSYSSPINRIDFLELVKNAIEKKTNKSMEQLILESEVSVWNNPYKDTQNQIAINAYNLKLTDRRTSKYFRPSDPLFRQECAVILTNAADLLGRYTYNLPSKYQDTKKINSWARNSVDYVSHRKIMGEAEKGCFNPKDKCTVEQAITYVLKLYEDDGVLNISKSERNKIAADGKLKLSQTQIPGEVYPACWGDYQSKPVGSIAGYALETDVAIYIDGKYVKSYKVGNKTAVKINDLKQFGFRITVNSKQKEIHLIRDAKKTKKEYHSKMVDKSKYLSGNAIYTLVGSDYTLRVKDERKEEKHLVCAEMFTTTTGERMIPIQELGAVDHNEWGFIYALAIIDDSDPKNIQIHTTSNEREAYYIDTFEVFWAVGLYPSMAKYLLDRDTYKVFPIAQKIVAEVIKPGMTDYEKVKALQKHFSTYKFDFSTFYVNSGSGPSQNDIDYKATKGDISYVLTHKYGNWRGWINTTLLIYSMAGLDVYPLPSDEVYEVGGPSACSNLLPVKMDGKWRYVMFMFDRPEDADDDQISLD